MNNKCNNESLLSAEMRLVVAKQQDIAEDCFVTGDDVSPDKLRENYNREREFWNAGGYEPKEVREVSCPVEGGEISLRAHYPHIRTQKGAILFIHGGGFMTGNNDTHSLIMRRLCEYGEIPVIGVEYRLAPEFKMPTQINDCVAAIDYIRSHGEEFDIDSEQLILSGDSAGASLCMIMNLLYRDDRGDNSFISGLMLYYGQYGLQDSVSSRLYGSEMDGMRPEDIEYYMSQLIDEPGDFMKYLRMFDIDLTYGMPKTYISCGGVDPLRDDSVLLHEILRFHDIPVRLDIFEGVLHAFLHYSKMLPQAIQAMKAGLDFIQEKQ